MSLPVTSLFAAFSAVWLIVLSASVILRRRKASVGLGAGGDVELERKIRAQANFTEYTPFALILSALAEVQGAHGGLLGAAAAIYLAGRVAHGYALAFTASAPLLRVAGVAATMNVLALLAGLNLWLSYGF